MNHDGSDGGDGTALRLDAVLQQCWAIEDPKTIELTTTMPSRDTDGGFCSKYTRRKCPLTAICSPLYSAVQDRTINQDLLLPFKTVRKTRWI